MNTNNMQMKKTIILLAAVLLLLPAQAARKAKQSQQTDREYWCSLAYKIAQPVLGEHGQGRAPEEHENGVLSIV